MRDGTNSPVQVSLCRTVPKLGTQLSLCMTVLIHGTQQGQKVPLWMTVSIHLPLAAEIKSRTPEGPHLPPRAVIIPR